MNKDKTGYEDSYASTDEEGDIKLSDVVKRKRPNDSLSKRPSMEGDHLLSRQTSQNVNGHSGHNEISSRRVSVESKLGVPRSRCQKERQVKGRSGSMEGASHTINTNEKTDYAHTETLRHERTDQNSTCQSPEGNLHTIPSPVIDTVQYSKTKLDDSGVFSDDNETNNNNNQNNKDHNENNITNNNNNNNHNYRRPNYLGLDHSRLYTGYGVPPKYRLNHSRDSGVASGSESTDSEGDGRGSCSEDRMTPTEDRWGPAVPPKKRWLPRSMDYHGQVLVTDVTCHCVTVTFLESATEKGFFKEYLQ